MKRIILASGSPRRKELLELIGLKFEIAVSHKEEYYKSVLPEEIVKELSLMKAENVASEQDARNMIVIGADTIVVQDNKILGKPKDENEAYYMLKSLQGRAHQVFTGVAILDYDSSGSSRITSHAEETKVYVHEMEDEEIQRYIRSKEPMDKAGAYGIQGKFAAYIDKIEGNYYNVVGLPVSYVYQKVKKGVRPF
ncbi:Maf family protein [Clostridium sp. C105KSO13]|uniref:Maf family protein n=1 Tax=Clostridium sp. C105KSO13 TaxID=1776045 RepID=UPI0007407D3C|nr:Maf family protein [Clostridium sp. C105KSO13]CUX32289.1 Septum formation protein Maf [Clostridium sp. C105KSO13]